MTPAKLIHVNCIRARDFGNVNGLYKATARFDIRRRINRLIDKFLCGLLGNRLCRIFTTNGSRFRKKIFRSKFFFDLCKLILRSRLSSRSNFCHRNILFRGRHRSGRHSRFCGSHFLSHRCGNRKSCQNSSVLQIHINPPIEIL